MPRLRRASPITHYIVAAALEALGDDATAVAAGKLRLGIVLCVMSGCVNYSRRYYDEALRDPATASPLLFPETVFNAPASHIAALLGTPALNYTLVGDPGAFFQGVALAAQWLLAGQIDACLVVGGEECDWLTANAFHLFSRLLVLADGAGALYLKATATAPARRTALCHRFPSVRTTPDPRAPGRPKTRAELPACAEDSSARRWPPERPAFRCRRNCRVVGLDCRSRFVPKRVLGEGLMAAAAWQCVAAVDALATGTLHRRQREHRGLQRAGHRRAFRQTLDAIHAKLFMRIILITGANGGLGQAIARAFLDESPDNFVCLGIRERRDKADALAAEFPGRCALNHARRDRTCRLARRRHERFSRIINASMSSSTTPAITTMVCWPTCRPKPGIRSSLQILIPSSTVARPYCPR